ncbi:MAG: helix-turn-helix domain-containing protein [Brachybacterium sp.]|uniref:helix-turn-helix domain-containing protein n=1 Tax=Micrococcales TaxID=85006 RepID=UPI003F9A0227
MSLLVSDAPGLVRAARRDAGTTQNDLANAVGARQPHIAGIESGHRPVSPELLDRLLAAADYRPLLGPHSTAPRTRRAGRAPRHTEHPSLRIGRTGL